MKGSIALIIVAMIVALCPFQGCASAAKHEAEGLLEKVLPVAHRPAGTVSRAPAPPAEAPGEVGPPVPTVEQIQAAGAAAMAKMKGDFELRAEKDKLEATAAAARMGAAHARAALSKAADKLGIVCTVAFGVAVLALIASFVIGIVPKTAAAWCFGFAGACLAAQYGILKYGVFVAELAFWISLALALGAAAAAIVPFAITLVNWSRKRVGHQLIADGDVRAGVAMVASADSNVNRVRAPLAAALEHMAQGIDIDHSAHFLIKKLGIPTPAVGATA